MRMHPRHLTLISAQAPAHAVPVVPACRLAAVPLSGLPPGKMALKLCSPQGATGLVRRPVLVELAGELGTSQRYFHHSLNVGSIVGIDGHSGSLFVGAV